MIVSHETLLKLLDNKEIIIDPLNSGHVQPASIDLTLGNSYLKVNENAIDHITLDTEISYIEFQTSEIVIPAHSFLLAVTKERIKLPNYLTAFVEGRSSVGRMGLFIQNAGWVDPGFEGTITLELFNANPLPIRLYSGRRICQLVFAQMDKETTKPYAGKYQNQSAAVGSRIYLDEETPQKNFDSTTPL